MKYYSTNKISPAVSFEDAVVRGLAPDKGLYFPEKIGTLPKGLIGHNNSIHEIAFEVAKLFVDGEIDNQKLQTIVEETLAFPTPIVNVEKDVFSLELWHGPTCAFKDVGARFLARCLSYFVQRKERKVTILVATSGDTGSAVANGFLGVEGIDAVTNNITVIEKPAKTLESTTGKGRNFAQYVADVSTTASIKTELLASPNIKGLAIDVDTLNHKVTLSGQVGSLEEKALAQAIAAKHENVKGVVNNLQVKS